MGDKVVKGSGLGYLPSINVATQIRLLNILPGDPGSELRAELSVADLDQEPVYQCISYAWGLDDSPESINIAGTVIPITRNLFAALSRIRSLHEGPVVIWADSICINQSDDEEKSHQVSMMKRIYQRCSNCFIWLGEVDSSNAHESSMADEAVARTTLELLEFLAKADKDSDLPSSLSQPGVLEEIGNALRAMMKCAWWTRMWTLQECTVASQATVLWGALTIDWQTILDAACSMIYCEEFKVGNQLMLAVFPDYDIGFFTGPIIPLRSLKLGYNETPMGLLWRYSYRKATKPQDMVYAVVPLMDEGALPNVAVDYSLQTSTLYQIVTRDLILSGESLIPLVGRTGYTAQHPDLPSWVLDWPRVQTQMSWWPFSYLFELFDAACGLPPLDVSQLSPLDGRQLRLRGFYVDKIQIHGLPDINRGLNSVDMVGNGSQPAVSPPYPANLGHLKPNMARWHHSIKSATFDLLLRHCHDREAATEMLGELEHAIDQAVDGVMISDQIPDPGIAGKTMRDVWTQDVQDYRILFVTQSALFGFAPANLQPGDEIWILCGSGLPFLLRPRQSAAPGQARSYELVGDCYLDRNMWGESVEENKEKVREVNIE